MTVGEAIVTNRGRRRVVTVTAVLLLATTLVACQNGRVGGRCKAGTVAQDPTHVLVCKSGRWSRLISKADGMRELARIKAEEAAAAEATRAAANPPAAEPPVTAPPATEPPATAPPATTPPATAPPATIPPTTAAPTTTAPTTTAAPTTTIPTTTTTTTTTAPPTTTTAAPTTTTTPPTATSTTTTPPTTTSTTTPGSTSDLDPSFGAAGAFDYVFPRQAEHVQSATSSAGGTTYVMSGFGSSTRIRRLTAGGTVDTTFGNGGTAELPTPCSACGLGVDDDNRPYVWVNQFTATNETVVRITRLTWAGQVDTSYGVGGTVSTTIVRPPSLPPTMSVGLTASLAVSPSGLVAVASSSPLIVELFDADGDRISTTPTALCSALQMAFDHADRLLLLSGACTSPTSPNLSRFTTAGQFDPAFGGGTVGIGVTTFGMGRGLTVDSSNRPYVNMELDVRRLTVNGVVDTTFGVDGLATFPTTGGRNWSAPDSLVVTANGVHGVLQSGASHTNAGAAVVRLTPNGLPDTSFSGDGVYEPPAFAEAPAPDFGSVFYNPVRLVRSGSGVVMIDDTIVVDPQFGRIPANGFLKVDSTGLPESAYGNAGLATMRFGVMTFSLLDTWAGPSGSVYLGFGFEAFGFGVVVLRVTASGTLDAGFHGDGVFSDPTARSMTVDSAGRVVVYHSEDGTSASMSFGSAGPIRRSITRLTTAGAPDASFDGGDGTIDWPDLTVASQVMVSCPAALTARTDASIVVAYPPKYGSVECSPTGLDLVRPGGQIDSGFGPGIASLVGGRRIVDVAPAPGSGVLVLATSSTVPGETSDKIVRLNADGSVDGTFSGDGVVDIAAGGLTTRVDVMGDGSVIAASGSAAGMSFSPTVAPTVRRFLADGTPVTSGGFAPSGAATLTDVADLRVTPNHIVGVGGNTTGIARVFGADGLPDTSFPGPGDDGAATFQRGDRRIMPAVSNQRAYVVLLDDQLRLTIHRLRGTVG